MEPHYNEDLGTMEIALLYQVSPYITVKKQQNTKSWDQHNYLVITGFCYIQTLYYNEVPLYLVPCQSGTIALFVAFYIMLFAFVNQELCHVLCDEAKSRLCHFLYSS